MKSKKGEGSLGPTITSYDQVEKLPKIPHQAQTQAPHFPEGLLCQLPSNCIKRDNPVLQNQPATTQCPELVASSSRSQIKENLRPVFASNPVEAGCRTLWCWGQYQSTDRLVRRTNAVKWLYASHFPQPSMLIPQPITRLSYPFYTVRPQIHAYLPRLPLLYRADPADRLALRGTAAHVVGQGLPQIWKRTASTLGPCAYFNRATPIVRRGCPGYVNTGPRREKGQELEHPQPS
ncbi:uncharacterized protein [Hemitrygon akajei]|uniref:uncharacterized protein n=1 Tax=Hemitrygon akajei TaxID=2704970 RepID=UPI003BF9AD41